VALGREETADPSAALRDDKQKNNGMTNKEQGDDK
jgi:hypothetical protein